MSHSVELDFICDTCGRSVENGQGALYVRYADLSRARAERTAGEKTRDASSLDIAAVLTLGAPAPWLIHHDTCAPADSDGYDIAVEQVRTWRALVKWTAYLMSKTWLPVTNWAVVIGSAAEGRDRRIVEHVRGDAA